MSAALALGGVDFAGGRVLDRQAYGVVSVNGLHWRATAGATHRQEPLLALEVEPGVPWTRMVATQSQVGLAAIAPGWGQLLWAVDYQEQDYSWQLSLQKSFEDFPEPPPVPRGWNAHYTPRPLLFDVVAVETGPYHYQLMMGHELRLRGVEDWRLAAQVRQPLVYSRYFDDGKNLSRFREDGWGLRQSELERTWRWESLGLQASGMLGTYLQNWWFWRLQAGWQAGPLTLAGYFAYFDNPMLDEYRQVWVPSATLKLGEGRYALRLLGGTFWDLDRGVGASLLKRSGSVEVDFSWRRAFAQNGHSAANFIGVAATVPLCLAQDVALGTPRLTVNGPTQWTYGLRTRLIQPGSRNTVAPLALTEPEWLVP